MPYGARLINPYNQPAVERFEWDLLLTDDGATVDAEGQPIALPDVRVPVKFHTPPTTAELLAAVRHAVVVHGERPQTEADALASVLVDWPVIGTVEHREAL